MTAKSDLEWPFLAGGGEMGTRMRSLDWSATAVGDPSQWPDSLRLAVQLLLNNGHSMYIFWGSNLTCFYNDPQSRSLGPEQHPASLGQPAASVWGEIWHVLGPQVDHVMAGKGSTWQENALVPLTRFGHREPSYWTYGYSPIADEAEANGVGGILIICTETTAQVLAEHRLAAQVKRQREQFEQAPGFICVLLGADHVFDFVNQAYRQLLGDRDYLGRSVRQVVPEVSDQGFYRLLDEVFESGQRHVARQTPIRLNRDGIEVERLLDFIYEPILDDAGKVIGIFVEGFDVTGEYLAHQAQQRQARHLQLLVDELNHRVKNTLSIVQGLAHQTFKGEVITNQALSAFDGRLMALAAAHDVLTKQNWEAADLHEIASQALAIHGLSPTRYFVEGPSVDLVPEMAVSLAIVLHELSTNAFKYGSLSNDRGTVHVGWSLEEGSPRRLLLEWVERDGPAVLPPTRFGFGSAMIRRIGAADPRGRMGLEFATSGVTCRIQMELPEALNKMAVNS